MRRYLHLLGNLLVLLTLIFFFHKLVGHLGEIPRLAWSRLAIISFLAAVCFCALVVAVGALIWVILLRGGGVVLACREAYIIVGYSQIAKYLPGNVFHYISRMTLGHRAGIPSEAVLLSLGVETFLAVVAASCMAVAGLLFDNIALPTDPFGMTLRSSIPLLLAVGLVILGGLSLLFVHNVREWVRRRLAYLHPKRVGLSIMLYLAVFASFGFVILRLTEALWGIDTSLHWYQFSWGFALAWVLGFVVPGAPGGIGIRETVFVGLYGYALGEGVAIGLAAVLRVVTSAGDLATFSLAYWLDRRKGRKPESGRMSRR
jgi:uncharacterized membrane protein YbhN (UPF0104 family)